MLVLEENQTKPALKKVSVEGDEFLIDGLAGTILSGSLHYFRVVSEYWEDRLLKLKACGLNTVETYVPWNFHEARPGAFRFDGMRDIERFISIAGRLDLMVIVRPGPYICSEWDLGGLPSWLLSDPEMVLRCSYPPYLEAVDRWFDVLLPKLAALQVCNGGPIVGFQVENEYGSFGNDASYLRFLVEGMRRRGIEEFLFTSDGPSDSMLQAGGVPGVLKTANFGNEAVEAFGKLREHQQEGPLMCGEFWNGWFDHWGGKHHTRESTDAANALDDILKQDGSVNLYMFHGGTTFGFMSGANHDEKAYHPDVNSYDFDAPLDESGRPTEKYFAFREVIQKYPSSVLPMDLPPAIPTKAFGTVDLYESAPLFDVLAAISQEHKSLNPQPMEMYGQDYGFILYRTMVQGPYKETPLILQKVRDRALVFLDGVYRGVVDRNTDTSSIQLSMGPGRHRLDILVENQGRVNYGPYLHDRKGITEGVRLGNQFLFHWTIFPLPLNDVSGLPFGTELPGSEQPCFYRGRFYVDQQADTFLAMPGWIKGVCWLNGFNLGRYWQVGPQKTLYVPGPLLRLGENELTVFELHGTSEPRAEFLESPVLY